MEPDSKKGTFLPPQLRVREENRIKMIKIKDKAITKIAVNY